MIIFIGENYGTVLCILCFVRQGFLSHDFLLLNSQCYFIFSRYYLAFCIKGFLCINGGDLTVARVHTRSSRTLLPLVRVDYEPKHDNMRVWCFGPKLSNLTAMVIIVPFGVYKSRFYSVTFLMFTVMVECRCAHFTVWVSTSFQHGNGTWVPKYAPLTCYDLEVSILFVVLFF